MKAEVFDPTLEKLRKGAVLQIDDQPLASGIIFAELKIVRVQPEYDAEGAMTGGAAWLMCKAVGYDIDFNSVRTIRAESWASTSVESLLIKDSEGLSFLFTAPAGEQATALAYWLALKEDTRELDEKLLAYHKADSMKWTGPEEPGEYEVEYQEELADP
tara:strand:+ start:17221 stop:17697 length:477 start_codon:yes stop_codon:yes gene_type:complete